MEILEIQKSPNPPKIPQSKPKPNKGSSKGSSKGVLDSLVS